MRQFWSLLRTVGSRLLLFGVCFSCLIKSDYSSPARAGLALTCFGALVSFVNHRFSVRGRFALIGYSNSEQEKKVPQKQ